MANGYDLAQVQIRQMEIAREITKDLLIKDVTLSQDKIIEQRCKWFDQAYKAIDKTVKGK